jgi:hypothetical protein
MAMAFDPSVLYCRDALRVAIGVHVLEPRVLYPTVGTLEAEPSVRMDTVVPSGSVVLASATLLRVLRATVCTVMYGFAVELPE